MHQVKLLDEIMPNIAIHGLAREFYTFGNKYIRRTAEESRCDEFVPETLEA